MRLLADAAETQPATTRPSLRDDPRAIRWRKTIFWSAIVIFVGIVGSIAIVRFSRRYAAYLEDEPPGPTASEDVWSMHRLPPEPSEGVAEGELPADDDESADEKDADNDEPPPPS